MKQRYVKRDSRKGVIQLIKYRYLNQGVDEQDIAQYMDLTRELSLIPGVQSLNISTEEEDVMKRPPEFSMAIIFESEEAMNYFHSHPKKSQVNQLLESVSEQTFPFTYIDNKSENLL